MQIQQGSQQPAHQHLSEEILIISRTNLFKTTLPWQGIQSAIFNEVITNITEHGSYMPRSHAETNPAFKQIIPYVLFMYDQKLFVMQRKNTASEQRLANKFSLGIGGHIRQEDIVDNNVTAWAQREFTEEVSYQGSMKYTQIGILNDDSSDVGQVHLGIILLIHGNSNQITIKDEHKSGELLTIDECKNIYPNMENWSKICFDFILQHPELK